MRFDYEDFFLSYFLQNIRKFKLLVKFCIFSSIFCYFGLLDNVSVFELDDWILFAEEVGVFFGAEVDYLKQEKAVTVQFRVGLRLRGRDDKSGLDCELPRFLAVSVIELQIVLVLFFVLDKRNERYALALPQRVVRIHIMVERLEHEPLASRDLLVDLRQAETLVPLRLLSGVVFRAGAYFLTVVHKLDIRVLLADEVGILVERRLDDDDFEEAEGVELGVRVGVRPLVDEERLEVDVAALFEVVEDVDAVSFGGVAGAHRGERDGDGFAEQAAGADVVVVGLHHQPLASLRLLDHILKQKHIRVFRFFPGVIMNCSFEFAIVENELEERILFSKGIALVFEEFGSFHSNLQLTVIIYVFGKWRVGLRWYELRGQLEVAGVVSFFIVDFEIPFLLTFILYDIDNINWVSAAEQIAAADVFVVGFECEGAVVAVFGQDVWELERLIPIRFLSSIIFHVSLKFFALVFELDEWILLPKQICIFFE